MFGIVPAMLLRFLPHILIALGIIGAMLWIDHRGYQRAMADQQRAEARARVHIAEELSKIDGALGAKIDRIRILHRTIIQPMQKEIASDPRYRSPACTISDSLRAANNAARSADGRDAVAVPYTPSAR